ncbi:hypothetical protein EBB_04375 [Methylomonas sp. EbB]|uniref:Uncharacterized protein n=1 Tax=Methylomonas fluvii TaxID=1854564 RepID=A0ABR9DAD8_9GAMM|nr:hypothetical protein [Methylomonas fluvii]MBD9359796.1 hypothetical protein [Methylomonas fluvii]
MPAKVPNILSLLAWSQTWRLAFTLAAQIIPVLNRLYGALGTAYNLFSTAAHTMPESEIGVRIRGLTKCSVKRLRRRRLQCKPQPIGGNEFSSFTSCFMPVVRQNNDSHYLTTAREIHGVETNI